MCHIRASTDFTLCRRTDAGHCESEHRNDNDLSWSSAMLMFHVSFPLKVINDNGPDAYFTSEIILCYIIKESHGAKSSAAFNGFTRDEKIWMLRSACYGIFFAISKIVVNIFCKRMVGQAFLFVPAVFSCIHFFIKTRICQLKSGFLMTAIKVVNTVIDCGYWG